MLKANKTSIFFRHAVHDLTEKILHAECISEVSNLFISKGIAYKNRCYLIALTFSIFVDLASSRLGVKFALSKGPLMVLLKK